jgi:nucleotide-binding universal stress UspA family protein
MKYILVPVDGSDCANKAVEKAKELAKFYNSKITLLNVYHYPVISSGYELEQAAWIGLLTDELIKNSNDILEKAKAQCSDMADLVETVSLEGNPADQIIEYVCKHDDIEMVIMGTHGMGGFKRFMLGSTTHKVAVTIEKPILII